MWLLFIFLFSLSASAEDFCFGFLNSYPNRKEMAEAEKEKIQEGHLAHLGNMSKAGHLLAAGPLLTEEGPRGVVIYRCNSIEQAQQWTANDPAVINKRLTLDVHLWRGPSLFGEPLASSLKTDPNTKYEMVQLPLLLFRKSRSWESSGPVDVLAEQSLAIKALQLQGKVRAAGPFLDSAEFAALLILKDMTLVEATSLAKGMPLVRSGYATVQGYIWLVANESIPGRGDPGLGH